MAVDCSQFLGAPHMEEQAFANAALSLQNASYTEFFDYEFVGVKFPVMRNPDAMDLYDQDSIGSEFRIVHSLDPQLSIPVKNLVISILQIILRGYQVPFYRLRFYGIDYNLTL